jgi:hypothetical protein
MKYCKSQKHDWHVKVIVIVRKIMILAYPFNWASNCYLQKTKPFLPGTSMKTSKIKKDLRLLFRQDFAARSVFEFPDLLNSFAD